MSSSRKFAGRLFQTRGPATAKLLSPNVLCVRGTAHDLSLSVDERSRRRVGSPPLRCGTRKLCYRKDDRAMRPIGLQGCPQNFRESQTTPTATRPIPNIFHGLLFGSTLECSYKI